MEMGADLNPQKMISFIRGHCTLAKNAFFAQKSWTISNRTPPDYSVNFLIRTKWIDSMEGWIEYLLYLLIPTRYAYLFFAGGVDDWQRIPTYLPSTGGVDGWWNSETSGGVSRVTYHKCSNIRSMREKYIQIPERFIWWLHLSKKPIPRSNERVEFLSFGHLPNVGDPAGVKLLKILFRKHPKNTYIFMKENGLRAVFPRMPRWTVSSSSFPS